MLHLPRLCGSRAGLVVGMNVLQVMEGARGGEGIIARVGGAVHRSGPRERGRGRGGGMAVHPGGGRVERGQGIDIGAGRVDGGEMELGRGRKMGRVEELAHGRVGWALRWRIHRGGGAGAGRGGAGTGGVERVWLGRVFWTGSRLAG
jgi:hypothetical protein